MATGDDYSGVPQSAKTSQENVSLEREHRLPNFDANRRQQLAALYRATRFDDASKEDVWPTDDELRRFADDRGLDFENLERDELSFWGVTPRPLSNGEDESLRGLLSEYEIRPSYALTSMLRIMTEESAGFKDRYGYSYLLPGSMYLAFLTIGVLDQGTSYQDTSLPALLLQQLGIWRTELSRFKRDYYAEVAKYVEPPKNGASLRLSDDFIRIWARAKDIQQKCSYAERWVSARHLLAALITQFANEKANDLEIVHFDINSAISALKANIEHYRNDNVDEWLKISRLWPDNIPSKKRNAVTGGLYSTRRTALEEELCLDINAYSTAIAETFDSAAEDSDFIFALFGAWGRGKSTLMARVANQLCAKKSEKERGNFAKYHQVNFSAWRYPTRPEVWVYLYQTLSNAAQSGGWLQKIRIAFRVGLLKNGWFKIIFGIALVAVSRLQIDFAHWIFDSVGVVGLLIVISFIWNFSKLGTRLANTYFFTPDHAEKLGLQAVIGDDLKNLLKVWIQPQSQRSSSTEATDCYDFSRWGLARFKLITAVILIWIALGLGAWKLQNRLIIPSPLSTASIAESVNDLERNAIMPEFEKWTLDKRISLVPLFAEAGQTSAKGESSSTSIMLIALTGTLCLAVGGLAILVAVSPKRFSRALLVVDDLDRCEPEQMLAVIESIRLFLDDIDVSRRLQVAMLIDRIILTQAITDRARKAGLLSEHEPGGHFCRQQEEKLFVVSLELPPLDERQATELADKIVNREYRAQLQRENPQEPFSASTSRKDGAQISEPNDPKYNTRLIPEIKTKNSNPTREEKEDIAGLNDISSQKGDFDDKVTFTDVERNLLSQSVKGIDIGRLTPRSFRAFVIRYQLLRLVLRHLQYQFNPKIVIDYLADRLFGSGNRSFGTLDSKVVTVLNCVIGSEIRHNGNE